MPSGDSGSVYEFDEPSKFELLADVKASKRKTQILQELADSPRNSTDFAEEWDVTTEAVNYHLKELKERDLVRVLSEDRKQYRLWGVTETGTDIVELL